MTDKTDPIAHATRLLREAAQELQQGHTLRTTPNDWTGEPEAKAAYDEHMGAAAALECWAEAIGAGGVSGPLMGQPQEMPDLSALTERGAKAWAGVDAQGLRAGFTAADMATAAAQAFRDGVAAVAASAGTNCERCSGSGEDPEGFYEQSRGDAGHTHDGPCRSCGGSGAAASAGSEPVAWRYVDARGHFRYVGYKPSRDMAAEYPLLKPIRLYTHPSPPEGAGAKNGGTND